MEHSSKKWVGWVVLGLIVVIAGVALAYTNGLEQNSIPAEADTAIRALFPEADAGAAGIEAIELEGDSPAYRVKQGGSEVGYVIVTTTQGYGGPVEVTTGVEAGGAIRGISVGGANFNETGGLGATAKDASFTDQFKQKMPPLSLGNGIDAISGATVTSRAVVDGVNDGTAQLSAAMSGGSAGSAQRTASASVIGYAGPVLVRLTLDENNAISDITIGSERFMESEGVGARVREPGFGEQFIGKQPPVELDDIDAISGATVSSQAVVDAVNEAYAFLTE